ncbi:MAG: DUF503 domain-containing protein [bacterium]
MFVLVAKIKLFLNDSPQNLKQKRSIVNSIKQKIINKFKISIAEVDCNDKLQTATIGIAMVSNNQKILDQTINKIQDFIQQVKNISIIEISTNYYTE